MTAEGPQGFKVGDKVKVIAGKEKHPSHKGVTFEISNTGVTADETGTSYLSLKPTVEGITGPFNYAMEDLQIFTTI